MISSPRRRRQAKERPGVEVVVAQDDVGVTKEDGLLEGQQEHYQQYGDHASNNLAVEGSDLPPETAQDPDEEIPAAPIPTNPDLCVHAHPQPRSPVDPPPPSRVDPPTQQQRERIIFNKAELLSLRPVVHAKPIPQARSQHLALHHAALLARVDVIAALELD